MALNERFSSKARLEMLNMGMESRWIFNVIFATQKETFCPRASWPTVDPSHGWTYSVVFLDKEGTSLKVDRNGGLYSLLVTGGGRRCPLAVTFAGVEDETATPNVSL